MTEQDAIIELGSRLHDARGHLKTAKEIIVNFLEHRGEPAEAEGVVKTVLRAREFLLASIERPGLEDVGKKDDGLGK